MRRSSRSMCSCNELGNWYTRLPFLRPLHTVSVCALCAHSAYDLPHLWPRLASGASPVSVLLGDGSTQAVRRLCLYACVCVRCNYVYAM